MKELPEPTDALLERFKARLVAREVVPGLGPCLEMTGYQDGDGYVRFGVGEEHYAAHRLGLYWLGKQPVLPDKLVMHRCDNGRCCEPLHLLQGSNAENSADMAAKRRAKRMPGEAHPCAKVTASQLVAARAAYEAGRSIRELASELGIRRATLRRIFRGERWAHLKLAG